MPPQEMPGGGAPPPTTAGTGLLVSGFSARDELARQIEGTKDIYREDRLGHSVGNQHPLRIPLLVLYY